jgi:hypothetical protein
MCPRCQGHYCSGQQRSNDGPDSDVITSMAPFIESCLSLTLSRNFPRPVLRNRKCHIRGFPAYQITRCHVPDENNISSCPCPRVERCHAMPYAVSRRPRTAECGTVSQCGICGGQSGTGTASSPNNFVYPCQYRSTIAQDAFMHLSKMMYCLSNSKRHYPVNAKINLS